MLSILIPIYNYKVVKLVKALKKQCDKAKIKYEILCLDDGSKSKIKYENSVLSSYFGINYTELSENLGRARIRNWLAKIAAFDNLLFLDCDSKVIKKDFISNYLKYINDFEVIAGGRIYSPKSPRAKSKKLHWLYGSKRESKNAKNRQKNIINYFHSNNFLVKREIVIKYPFDEKIDGYGYEDILWAKHLFEKGISINHINNEIEHLGLEKKDVFLKKTKKSIENLKKINAENTKIQTRLMSLLATLQKYRLEKLVLSYCKKNKLKIERNLLSDNPNLYYLDLYKIICYCDL